MFFNCGITIDSNVQPIWMHIIGMVIEGKHNQSSHQLKSHEYSGTFTITVNQRKIIIMRKTHSENLLDYYNHKIMKKFGDF